MQQDITYLFDVFHLDTVSQVLWHMDTEVKLSPKAYRLLLYFLQHPGRLVSHQELFEQVWAGRVVDDSAIRRAVNCLRNALHDDSKSPRYILTVCKRGYRFMAAVTVKGNYKVEGVVGAGLLPYQPQAQPFPARREDMPELASLEQFFLEASGGERRLVFLLGEQRTGKTTLLNIFLAKVHHPELTVLHTHCVPMAIAPQPFMPLLEALERHCREPYGQLLIERLEQLAPTWLSQMLTVLATDVLTRIQPKIGYINTSRMLLEGADFIESLTGKYPLVLILDNAHWCDEFTLDLLSFLRFRPFSAKLLVVVSYSCGAEGEGARRIAKMQAELQGHGLCQVLCLQQSRRGRSADVSH